MPPLTITYEQLTPGHEFPPASYTLGAPVVARYLRAVGDSSGLYSSPDSLEQGNFEPGAPVPPTAVAALAMKSLLGAITLPPGSVHLSQDLEFLRQVPVGETITCRVRVDRKQERAGLRLLTLDLSVFNGRSDRVMAGKAVVTVPAGK